MFNTFFKLTCYLSNQINQIISPLHLCKNFIKSFHIIWLLVWFFFQSSKYFLHEGCSRRSWQSARLFILCCTLYITLIEVIFNRLTINDSLLQVIFMNNKTFEGSRETPFVPHPPVKWTWYWNNLGLPDPMLPINMNCFEGSFIYCDQRGCRYGEDDI